MTEVYQLDLDEELLSHLSDPESIDVIRDEEISVDLIEDEFVTEIFLWQMDHLFKHRKPATASVLADEFDLELEEPLTAIGDLIERLRERYLKNHTRGYMEEISDAYKTSPAKVIEVLPRVASEILNIAGPRVEHFTSEDFERALHKYNKDLLKGPGPGFGFEEINNHFHGMRGVTFVIGAPKTGKSWIGCNTVFDDVIAGYNMEIASLELPAAETDMRIRCLGAGVPYWRYVKGKLTPQDLDKLEEAATLLNECDGSYRVVKPAPGQRSFEDMWGRARERGADAIVIDQLQYVETRTGKALGGCDPREFWQPLNAARDMSDEMPMMIIHQFNRSVMNADQMPEMQQAKGAAAIEEVATLALGLWANKDMRRSGILEIGTLASRNFSYESWEVGMNLSRSCDFKMIGRVEADE